MATMRRLKLISHEGPITSVKYNRDGDMLFTASKTPPAMVWRTDNGMRVGSYDGEKAAISCLDVNHDTTRLITASAGSMIKLWDCETGTCLKTVNTPTSVRTCEFSSDGQMVFYTTDTQRKQCGELAILTMKQLEEGAFEYLGHINTQDTKVTAAAWGPFDENIVTGHEDGSIRFYQAQGGDKKVQMIKEERVHKKTVSDLKMTHDKLFILSASKDYTAKLCTADTLEEVKIFNTDRPVNAATISSIRNHVILGGGQEARDVTLTMAHTGKFEARIFHVVYEQEIGRVKGHFGPINTLAFHPGGKGYTSGGEDGVIWMQEFPEAYFDFEFDKFKFDK